MDVADRFSQEETADLLAGEYGLGDPDLADLVYEATAGHAALVRLCAQTLVAKGIKQGPLPEWEPGGPVATYVTRELLGSLPEGASRLVREVSSLAPVTVGLCEALGHTADSFAVLTAAGVLADGSVIPVVVQAMSGPAKETLIRAASWYEDNGPMEAAVRAYAAAGEQAQCARILDDHGTRLIAHGHAGLVADLLGPIPRTRGQQLLLGDALRTKGEVMGASHAYESVAGAEAEWDAGLAWRMGLVHYLRGDSKGALKAFDRATARSSTVDDALLLSWRAAAHLQLSELDSATEHAREATRLAAGSGDDTALATAYVSLALCLTMSDDPTELFAQALAIAERVGDVVLRARVLTNQTYQLLCEARYAQALEAARQTHQCAVAAGHTNLRSIALCNEGDALTMLGRFDEATRQYERAIALCRRMGSRRIAAAQLGLGEVYRRRGWWEQSRAAYENAARLAEEGGNVQVNVCALAGLARVLVGEDPKAARAAAEKAVSLATSKVEANALVAHGWVAQRSGDSAAAANLAGEAARVARAERDPAGLAESLELKAATEPELRKIRAALLEAQAIWAGAGAAVEAARLSYQLGHMADADTDDRLNALVAAEVLGAAGASTAPRADSTVVIRAFGRFEVVVKDKVVPATQWQSRKARDLLRILVARRGRPVPRAELCELLWPDDDPFKTGHRLSVLLSIVRNVLDPDRACATDHYLVADQASIGLDVTRLRVDIEEFLADVRHGRRLRDRRALAEARTLLEAAQNVYRADVFEDEPYSEWSVPLREEARAAYIGTLRMLAQLSQPEPAVGYLLRLLTIDPYDEAGHRALIGALVAGGQHGEAQRATARYREAMSAIGVSTTNR